MEPELVQPELPLMAAAVALGAICAMVAVLFLFPIVDRFIRPRFDLERGEAMLLLLAASLMMGTVGGVAGFFWLLEREESEGRVIQETRQVILDNSYLSCRLIQKPFHDEDIKAPIVNPLNRLPS